MANIKTFNSKNLSKQIQSLIRLGKEDLVMQILQANELKRLLPNILDILKREEIKKEEYQSTKIYSKTNISDEALKDLQKILEVDTKKTKIIIDGNMSPGVKVKSGDKIVDATLETMLQKKLEELLAK